jgi:hypothetical protein
MPEHDHQAAIQRILASFDPQTLRLNAREGSSVEFKESFNWANKDRYAKTMAAFANNRGGYLIFGVADTPRRLTGLSTTGFETQDEAGVTAYLGSLFAPEISYEKIILEVSGLKICAIYTHKHLEKPVIAIKNDGQIREGEIYYRYSGRSEKIRYAELKALFDETKERERKHWMDLFQRVSKIGPGNAGVMDVVNGTIEGSGGSLLIDAELVPKLRFIREGSFSEAGKPTLKLIGDVRPVAVTGRKEGQAALRITDDPTAPAVREETILEQYPLGYRDLVKVLRRRYRDFKETAKFHRIRQSLKNNRKYCRTRLLDPKNPGSSKKDFFSNAILEEFDKHYEKKPPPTSRPAAK